MTWRAFILGLVLVAAVNLITPYNDFDLANTYITGFHFPTGPFFLLVLLTLGVNVCVKLLRRAWALRQAELMLVWCLMIVGSTVPSSGLMRYLYPLMAAPSYYANESPEWAEEGHVLKRVPPQLVLSTEPNAPAAKYFYDGTREGEALRIPWRQWIVPITSWTIYVLLFYLATIFGMSMLRGWWVEAERLTFPLARVPLDLTEGSGAPRLLPTLATNRYFLVGAGLSFAAGLLRIFGVINRVWVYLDPLVQGSVLEPGQFGVLYVYPLAIGFAFLLPAQISFSFWFFRILTRFEFIGAYEMGQPLTHGDYGPFMQWQQAGAFIAFTFVMLWSARRHLWRIVRKAVGAAPEVDDSEEPISHALTFWGFLVATGGMVAWCGYFGMNPAAALLLIGLMFSILLVHARLVCQGGLFFTQQAWVPAQVVHSLTGGYGFSAPAVVVAMMQHSLLLSDARECLSPHAMNALRISSVFQKGRRLLLPAMLAALVVALFASGWASMRVYYSTGGLNLRNVYGPQRLGKSTFQDSEKMITQPKESSKGHWSALALGAGVMGALMVVRSQLHWWPIHPLGFLVGTTYAMGCMWFSFFVGWLIKVILGQFGGGKTLRNARSFFLGVIATEAFLVAVAAIAGLIRKEPVAPMIFLPG